MENSLIEKLINNGTPDMYAAFAETVKQEIANDDAKYESIGLYILYALSENNTEDVLLAVSGWYSETLLSKARIIPDVRKMFYSEPLNANIVLVDINNEEYFTPCKVNMQTFEVYDIQTVFEGCDEISNDAEIVEKHIIFDDMEDYRFPLKLKDEVFGPNCYQDNEELDYSEITSYWYEKNE